MSVGLRNWKPPIRFGGHHDLLKYCVQTFDLPGTIAVEFGVFEGRSLRTIRENFSGDVFGFDSFDGLPEDWRPGFPRGFFSTSARPNVAGTEIVEGLFQESLVPFLQRETRPISVVHLDADLYSSTLYCLNTIASQLAPLSVLILDEFWNYPGCEFHEQRAFAEFRRSQSRFQIDLLAYVATDSELENNEQVAFVIESW